MLTRKRWQAAQEEHILAKETEYLENTPSGNIIIGFDNYTKGMSTAAAQRRKTGPTDALRVFSRSSVSYNAAAATVGSTVTSNSEGIFQRLTWLQLGRTNARFNARRLTRTHAHVEQLWEQGRHGRIGRADAD